MKQSNLLSILILFFSLLSVQSVVAQVRVPEDETQPGTWYVIYDTNETEKSQTSSGNVKTYDNLKYPNKKTLSVDCYINGVTEKYTLNLYQTVNGNETKVDSKTISKGKKWTNGNIFSNINENTTKLRFEFNYNTYKRRIRNVFLEMAPHIKMSTTSVDFNFTGTAETDTTKKAVRFHSFLTSKEKDKGIMQYSIIGEDKDYFTLHDTKEIEQNTFCHIDSTKYDFKVSFHPIAGKDGFYRAQIKITDGVSTDYVNLTGHKHNQTISWDQNLTEMILYEVTELTAVASPDPQMPITYTWSPEDAFWCEGNRIVPIKVYENATITANQYGHEYYNIANSITKTVRIVAKEKNNITWQYNFTNLGITTEDRTYDLKTTEYGAMATHGEVKYEIISSTEGLIELTNDYKLIVKGNVSGTAEIRAYVEESEEYLGASIVKYIIANDGIYCNSIHTREETIESDFFVSKENSIDILFSYPITKISLEGNIGTTIGDSYGTLTITGEKGEAETLTFNSSDLTIQSTSITFDRATRKVTLKTNANLTSAIYIQNIQFHQAQYFELDDSEINFGEACYALQTKTAKARSISFSDVKNDIHFAFEKGNQGFSVDKTQIKTGCEKWGGATFEVSFTPPMAGNYEDVLIVSTGSETKRITLKGTGIINDHQLAWNTSDFEATYGDENIKFTPATDNANLSISYSSSDESVAKFIYNLETKRYEIQIVGVGTATLTAKAGNGTTYIEKTATKQIIVHKANQTIVWTNLGLTTADRQVKIAESDKQIELQYEIIEGQSAKATDNGTTISVVDVQTFKVKAYNLGNESYNPISDEKEFKATIGTIRFDNNEGKGDKHWSNPDNWLPVSDLNKQRNVAPSGVVNAEIAANATISNTGTINQINNITFDGGSLTIAATSALKANKITNENAENLILKASDKGNATLIYADGTPSATVEMHSKAKYGTKDTDGHHPEWQYMGVAVDGAKVSDFKYNDSRNAWLLKWEEKDNVTGDPWSDAPLAAGTALEAWAGYSISQPTATTYTMKGSLMNGDHKYTLTRTESTDPDCGFNLLANSYTAPIDITKLKIDSFKNADACIVLYNTGTYGDWEKGQTDETNPEGQLTVIPVEAAKAISEEQGLPTTIPSMQAFFVMAKEGGGTFTVDYETAVLGATNTGNQMRAPEMRDEFNVLKIMIKGENSRDQLFLLENENTSKAYDNGYEARKIFDAPRGHQMYATCEYGYASIDCSKSFIGQAIGLKGDSEGEKLTISFGIDKIKDYESLFLYDKATGEYVNIMAEEEYTFYGIRGADDNRFTIVTNPDDSNQTPPFVVIGNELAFDKSQIGTDNANIYIYDTLGRLLMTDKVNPGENYRIPDMPEGIYLVSMNGYTTKIVRK